MSTFASPSRQLFSIPYNYVLCMIENPSTPEVLQKLHQTCKFFFPKNPILMPDTLYCDENEYVFNHDRKKKIITTSKFWPTLYLRINRNIDTETFHRFSAKNVTFCYCTLTPKEFEMIIAENTVERIYMFEASVGMHVDEIITKLLNAVDFYFEDKDEIYTGEILQNLNSIQRKKKIERCHFGIHKVSKNFSPSLFIKFMQRNGTSRSEFLCSFGENLSDFIPEFTAALCSWKIEVPKLVKHQLALGNCFWVTFL